MQETAVKRPLFGKEVEIVLHEVQEPTASLIIEECYALGLRLSRIFSAYDPSSELSRLNASRSMRVSREFLDVLNLSLIFAQLTGGRYDPALGKAIMRRKAGLCDIPSSTSHADILVQDGLVALKHPDTLLDLGSIAKGYIVDRMVSFLQQQGVLSGLIDGRGDIRVFGDVRLPIAIQHPRHRDSTLGHVMLNDAGIATSGDYNQYSANYADCHILNRGEAISVTVVAPSLTLADVWASALFVSNSEQRHQLLTGQDSIQAWVMTSEGCLERHNAEVLEA